MFFRHATLFSPVLPQSKITAIDKISIGTIGKVALLFPNPWWGVHKSDGHQFVWRAEDRKGLGEEWAGRIVGATIPMGNRNVMTVLTSGETAQLVS